MRELKLIDKPELLRLMLEDLKSAPSLYKPTNFWAVYEKTFLPELYSAGLRDFRRRENSVFTSFGATDLRPRASINLHKTLLNNRFTRKIPLWTALLGGMSHFLTSIFPVATPSNLEDLGQMAYEFARMKGQEAGAKSIAEIEDSLVGNPEYVITVEKRRYTLSTLVFYLRYAYCCQFVNFAQTKVIVELGSGSGKQIEVLKKLHPETCFLVFDIPPQLYVGERYLATVFPESVVSYKDTREIDRMSEPGPGKIFMFPSWKFSLMNDVKLDLFWNARSFQEMEPDVVANYLKYVNKQANGVFLQQRMTGKETAKKKGQLGVLKQVTIKDYMKGLSSFRLVDMSPSWGPMGRLAKYSDSFWLRA